MSGHARAKEAGPKKGASVFLQLLSAHAGMKDSKTLLALLPAEPKSEASLAALLKATKKTALPLPSKPESQTKDATEGVPAAAEKPDAKKKAAHTQAASAHHYLGAEGNGVRQEQSASIPAAAQKQEAANAGDPPAAARSAASQPPAAAIRIVDLRRAHAPQETDDSAAARRTSGPVPAEKDAPAPFAPRLAAAREPTVDFPQKPAASPAANAQTPLERLREMAGSELLKSTNLILRDGGGEIKLVLKPESLGSVRIRMNLVDNTVEGRIIVDSAAVKHVFDGSVDALRRALTAEGFQTGSLQVSVGGQNADTGERRGEQEPTAAVRRITAQDFQRNVPGVENAGLEDLLVNLFA